MRRAQDRRRCRLSAVATLLRARADDALVPGHRLSEWCAHAPTREEDLALANTALDRIGLARALYAEAGGLPGQSEDDLAYLRSDRQYRNCLLVELPNREFAVTDVRCPRPGPRIGGVRRHAPSRLRRALHRHRRDRPPARAAAARRRSRSAHSAPPPARPAIAAAVAVSRSRPSSAIERGVISAANDAITPPFHRTGHALAVASTAADCRCCPRAGGVQGQLLPQPIQRPGGPAGQQGGPRADRRPSPGDDRR